MLQFTVPQLQDLLTAVRLRRDLDLPNGAKDNGDTEGASAGGRQKRTLLDSSLPNFNLWPVNQPILYMFDGAHSESNFIMNNLSWYPARLYT